MKNFLEQVFELYILGWVIYGLFYLVLFSVSLVYALVQGF